MYTVCVLYIRTVYVGVHACKHANSYCIYACMYKFLIHMECDSRMLTFCKCFIHLVPYCLNCFIQCQMCQLLTQCSVFNKTLMLNFIVDTLHTICASSVYCTQTSEWTGRPTAFYRRTKMISCLTSSCALETPFLSWRRRSLNV